MESHVTNEIYMSFSLFIYYYYYYFFFSFLNSYLTTLYKFELSPSLKVYLNFLVAEPTSAQKCVDVGFSSNWRLGVTINQVGKWVLT